MPLVTTTKLSKINRVAGHKPTAPLSLDRGRSPRSTNKDTSPEPFAGSRPPASHHLPLTLPALSFTLTHFGFHPASSWPLGGKRQVYRWLQTVSKGFRLSFFSSGLRRLSRLRCVVIRPFLGRLRVIAGESEKLALHFNSGLQQHSFTASSHSTDRWPSR